MFDEFRDAAGTQQTWTRALQSCRRSHVVSRSPTSARRRGGGTQMCAHDGVDEHHVAVAAALQRARDAVAALAEPSPTFMDGMRSALQQADRRRCSSSREEGGRGGMN